MTISTQDSKVNYQGNGQTTVFQIPFPFLENNQIYVQKKDAEGILINYTYATDYTVTGAGEENGGSVTLNVAPEQGSTISIYRDVPLTQEVDYRENEIFPAETHEEALDKLTMEVQQIQEQLDRSVKVDRFSDVDLDIFVNAIERVYESTDNIDITANNIKDVNTVADNIANVNTVAGDIDSVVTTATNIKDVNTVAQNKASLNITAANIEDIKTVSSIKGDVHTVAGNNTNITAVGNNISDVTTAATNIEAIKDAPNQATNAAQSATNAANSATDSANYATASATSAQAAQDAADKVQGMLAIPIGAIFQSVYVDESLDIARQLNGQLISSTKFTGFRSWLNTVQTATPNLFTTEVNWQAEKTNSKLGQCGKFVVDDTAGTIRLPCVVNAQGLVDLALIGGIKSESLPNVTGTIEWLGPRNTSSLPEGTGAFSTVNLGSVASGGTTPSLGAKVDFNASRSSSTYQDNAPVQQEAVQYPYYIQVATGIEETLPAIREYNINTPFFFGQSMYSDVAPDNASWLVSNGSYNARAVYPDYYDWLVEQMNAGVSGFVASTATYTDYDFVINTTDQTFRLPLLNGEEDLLGDRKTSLTIGATGSSEIAPANGFYCLHASNNTSSLEIYVGTSTNFTLHATTRDDAGWNGVFVNVSKGDRIEYYYAGTGTPDIFQFIYAKGNGTLYYYVGDTVQDASLINAGAILGQLSNKADIDLSGLSAAGQDVILNIAAKGDNPTGTIIIWSAPTPPAGYLICDGAAISRTTYAALFQVIGTTWGAGDGNTTFNLPNFVGGFIPTSKQQNVTISSTGQPLTYIGTNNVQTTFHNRVDGDPAFGGVVIGTNADSGAYKYLSGLTASSSISGTPNITFCIRY